MARRYEVSLQFSYAGKRETKNGTMLKIAATAKSGEYYSLWLDEKQARTLLNEILEAFPSLQPPSQPTEYIEYRLDQMAKDLRDRLNGLEELKGLMEQVQKLTDAFNSILNYVSKLENSRRAAPKPELGGEK